MQPNDRDDCPDAPQSLTGPELQRLVAESSERLRRLASRMLDGYPALRRWEETGDLLQNTQLRLCKALEAATIESSVHYRRLAAWHMRRELLDMARRHFGPLGDANNHHSDGPRRTDDTNGSLDQTADIGEPTDFEGWTQFHEAMRDLPPDERDVADLLWYGGLTGEAAAGELGVNVRTIKRRWQSARRKLFRAMNGLGPG